MKRNREDRFNRGNFNKPNKKKTNNSERKEGFVKKENFIKEDDFELREEREDLLIGRNSVMEALLSGRQIEKILVSDKSEGSIKKLVAIAKDAKILVDKVEKMSITRIVGHDNHQGVIAFVSEFEYSTVEDILDLAKERGEEPFIVILDGITDPHNLGAIMRTAECTGVHGIIIPKRRSVSVNTTVDKAAAGASQHIMVAKVTNIASTLEQLKNENIWIYSCHMNGENIFDMNFDGGVALLLGNEGKGVSKIVLESSDFIISIPMRGKINSLNVSNAGAIAMYQVANKKFF